ncbi:MAG TPA: bifunctional serine/threonine-protein kinase/formylglycine-generating enzyme family protein [Rhodanobacteraceae bacterium]|nr:bifunctional serine/threonine-protein kinase/formylglycine-generating enzyme family protein [Rhodanobacteraceae bacterium]
MNEAAQLSEVPGYRLVRPIGSSGATTVYQAIQRALERQVAVKVFDVMDADAAARFEPLLRTNARLSHPNILGVHQIGRATDGRLFHSMPFLVSAELSAHNLRAKPLKIAAVLREILDALGHAHRRGIVHGGIKPTNILFDTQGHVRLADFGIARCAAEIGLPHPVAANYQSPEQARGQPPGQRSDLYSVGVLAFQLLTGSLPFQGEDSVATAVAHIEQPIPRLSPMAAAWQDWIDRALTKAPEHRFQSAQEMADALSAIDGHGGVAAPRAKTRVSFPRWTIGVAASAVAVAALASWVTWGRHRPAGSQFFDPATAVSSGVAASGTVARPATPTEASSVSPLAQRIQVLLAQADTSRAAGHLFAPTGNNAIEQYLTVLMLEPGNEDAVAGIDAMLGTIRHRLDEAWRAGKLDESLVLAKRCDLLSAHAGALAIRGWRAQRNVLASNVGNAVVSAANARDAERIAALKPLAEALPAVYPKGFDLAAAERNAATPSAGTVLRDHGGPLLVYVPESGNAPAFAIARVEVTRADYATFVQATHRPDSRCLEAHNPFSRMRRLTWQAPGFAQSGDHPAVCVSWNDAVAYSVWLSKSTGETYRLPSADEWLRAAHGMPKDNPCQLGNVDDVSRQSAMDNDRLSCNDGAAQTAPVGRYAASGVGAFDLYGNVSEWLKGGSAGARVFRGLSWRDGSRQTPLGRQGNADSDVGYTSVGFRVVRVIDPAHPAPPAASSR